jgi:hypothetical protein
LNANDTTTTTVEGHLQVNGKSRPFLVISVRAAAVIVVGIVVALGVFGGVVEYVVHDYVHRIAVSQCEVGNDSRSNDLAAWEKLGEEVGTNTPKAEAFLAFVRKKDAQRVLIGDKCALPPSAPQPTSPTTTRRSP